MNKKIKVKKVVGSSAFDTDTGLLWGGETYYAPVELPEEVFGFNIGWVRGEESWILVPNEELDVVGQEHSEQDSDLLSDLPKEFVRRLSKDEWRGWVEILNLTPHKITIIKDNGDEKILYVDGPAVRVETSTKLVGGLNGISLYKTEFGEVINLPEKKDGTFIVVSRMVKSACHDRDDLVVPAEIIRNDDGEIIGCRGLSL